jgi:putative ABC transport system substrate-binding protein
MQLRNLERREFVLAIAAAVAWPLAARGQQSGIPIVGYLGLTSADAEAYMLAPFRKGLSDGGFEDNRNVAIEYRFAERDISRLPALAAELVGHRPAVIFTGTTVATLALKAATSSIPIVFATGSDPVHMGLVASLAHPGGNLTGLSFFTNQMEAKRLGLLHQFVPQAGLTAVLLNPRNPFFKDQLADVQDASRALGLKLLVERASDEREIAAAFAAFAQAGAGAVLVGADPYFNSRRELVVAPAAHYRLPAIYEWREFVEAGGAMSYGTSLTAAYRQASDFVIRILKGGNPADLPVLQSTRFEFVINLKTARTLGVEVPPGLSAIADEVIE